MKTVDLELGAVRTDGGTQMRAKLDQDVYLDYRDKMKAGDEFPAVDVFYDGSEYWLADGFHRFYGAREGKLKTIKAHVHQGTQRDAILFAVGANTKHGHRRSNADKRNCILTLLNDSEWAKGSDSKLAEQAGVSRNFVAEMRVKAQPASDAGSTRTGKDGKERKAPPPRPPRKNDKPARAADPEPAQPAKAAPPPSEPPTFAEIVKVRNLEIDRYCQRIAAAFKDAQPGDAWLDDSRLNIAKQQIDSALATIRIAKAHDKPCPKCDGKGCKLCRQCGYLPKNEYQMAGGN